MPKLGDKPEPDHDILYTSSAPSTIPDDVLTLAKDLSEIHGTVRITTEKSGIHVYMASPACLEEYGSDELSKMHLAVNLQKYLATGDPMVGFCMKTETKYNILDLLAMPPLSERGYEDKPYVVVKKAIDEHYLEPDADGNMVPKSPGDVMPILDLPAGHQALEYLESRGYSPEDLWNQFGLSYCTQERSDIFYRRLLGGFRATPQGRIVFYIKQKGIIKGWQARILEMKRDGYTWFWHPYKMQWTAVLRDDPEGGKGIPLAGFTAGKWDPAKYIIAHGCAKSDCLIGYDATMQAIEHHVPGAERWCGLVEGPLDAGRFGVPFMGIMGKSLSDEQARLLQEAKIDHAVYVRDKDEAGAKGAASVTKQLAKISPSMKVTILEPPEGYKDLGEMTTEAAREFVLSKI